ncbi:MAG: MATE family efflux transporter [Chloroflexi bacterium]|nr:MATE family efflux transporter [Chloroflexota bacterium]
MNNSSFIRTMLSIAVPVAFQQLISALLNMVDVLMVGQLGETAIAALGLANQVFFLFILFLFGVTSGMAIFTAQYWGKGDVASIRLVLGISLTISVLVSGLFTVAALVFPETIMGFYTQDREVIELGASYLRIVGISYVMVAIVTSYIAILRSVTLVALAAFVTVVALVLKTGLGYMLIFGLGGFPAMGVRGAATATALGWTFELVLLLVLVYTQKTPLAANPLTFFRFDRVFLFKVLKTSMPAAINEVFWSFGITVYNAVYAHIGTDAIAAININATIEELFFVLFIGMGNACSVMVGNKIGAGEKEVSYEYGRRFLNMGVLGALIAGGVVVLIREPYIALYDISTSAADNVRMLMLFFSMSLWLRVHNFMLFIGALRAGGDTRYTMFMEIFSIWVVGVPMALLGGFVFHLPVYWVYVMVLAEEAVKAVVIQFRFRSRKWIHDLVNVEA